MKTNTFKTTLHVVPDTTELDRQLAEQGRTDFTKRELKAPHFPDHSKRDVVHGTLRTWLDKLSRR